MDIQTKRVRLFDAYPDIARECAQRLHRKKEDFEFVQKFFVSEKAESLEAERAIVAYISTGTVDRDNEVLLPKGMKSGLYEKSGKPVFWGHNYAEPRDIIGQCQWLKPNAKGIIAKTAFRNNEFSDEVYQLYSEDLTGQGPILRGWSVGFVPLEWEDGKKPGDPRHTFTSWELLEFSAVSIPCNPDAQTILGRKGIKLCDKLRHDLEIPDEPAPLADGAVMTREQVLEHCLDVPVPEPAAEPEARVIKTFDTEQNPSIGDITEAVQRALHLSTMQEKPGSINTYKALWDLYPVDYPSGHCVYRQVTDGVGVPEFFLCDYIYENGAATFGESTVPVVPAYAKRRGGKKAAETDAGSVCIKITADTSEIEAKIAALEARLAKIANRAGVPASPASAAPPAPDEMIEINPDEEIEIDDDDAAALPALRSDDEAQIMRAVSQAIDKLDIKDIVENSVRLHLDKIRGRVR